jgi:hypothetical protein
MNAVVWLLNRMMRRDAHNAIRIGRYKRHRPTFEIAKVSWRGGISKIALFIGIVRRNIYR